MVALTVVDFRGRPFVSPDPRVNTLSRGFVTGVGGDADARRDPKAV